MGHPYFTEEGKKHIQRVGGVHDARAAVTHDATSKDNKLPVDTVALNDRTNKALARTGRPENMTGTEAAYTSWMEDMNAFGYKYDSLKKARKGEMNASPSPDARKKIPLKGVK